jgi:Flp pilus assembly pilin Flp
LLYFLEVNFRPLSRMQIVFEPFLAFLRTHLSRRKGQTLVEYALILALVCIVMVAVFSLLGARIVIIFSAITNLLDTAQSSH